MSNPHIEQAMTQLIHSLGITDVYFNLDGKMIKVPVEEFVKSRELMLYVTAQIELGELK